MGGSVVMEWRVGGGGGGGGVGEGDQLPGERTLRDGAGDKCSPRPPFQLRN